MRRACGGYAQGINTASQPLASLSIHGCNANKRENLKYIRKEESLIVTGAQNWGGPHHLASCGQTQCEKNASFTDEVLVAELIPSWRLNAARASAGTRRRAAEKHPFLSSHISDHSNILFISLLYLTFKKRVYGKVLMECISIWPE